MDEIDTAEVADGNGLNVDRREAIAIAAGAALTIGVPGQAAAQAAAPGAMPLRFMVNGREQTLSIDPRTSLLDLLR